MPGKSPFTIELTSAEKAEPEKRARAYTDPDPYYRDIWAKMVLLAAEGTDNQEIARKLDVPSQIVCRWRKRFYHQRLD